MKKSMLLACLFVLFASGASALDKKQYTVFVVVDTLKPKFQEVVDGFKTTLNAQLSAQGAKASYRILDTKTNPANVAPILKAIREAKPDLICAVNSPDTFADTNISLKLPGFKIVSENCVPVQSGVAKTWEKPDGHITGVGVFQQFNSLLRLAKLVNPNAKKLVFSSWDRMTKINDWFKIEIERACREENIELAEFAMLSSAEDEIDFFKRIDTYGSGYFYVPGISAWVHRDGSYADLMVVEKDALQKGMRHLPIYAYDEASVKVGYTAGTCVVWHDIGVQLGEKGFLILSGANPGDLPWEYPRKLHLMINLQAAKRIGLTIPQQLINAAYRVYMDYDGNFVGRKN